MRSARNARRLVLLSCGGLFALVGTGLALCGGERALLAGGPVTPPQRLSGFQRAVLGDLDRQVRAGIRYQDGYFSGGDPPPDVGVCTDVVIRAYRAAGVDLQRLVADDVRRRRTAYRIERPDRDIDHRRCRNLAVFLAARSRTLPIGATDWQPGDLVFWDLTGDGRPDHVGVVANARDRDGNLTVVHHLPGAPVIEAGDLRFRPITHHFRWSVRGAGR